jgi:hypothetical protein
VLKKYFLKITSQSDLNKDIISMKMISEEEDIISMPMIFEEEERPLPLQSSIKTMQISINPQTMETLYALVTDTDEWCLLNQNFESLISSDHIMQTLKFKKEKVICANSLLNIGIEGFYV